MRAGFQSVFSLGMGSLRLRLGFLLQWSYRVLGVISLMSLSLVIRWIDLFLTVHLFNQVHLAYHNQVRQRFKLAAGLGEPWCRDGSTPQDVR